MVVNSYGVRSSAGAYKISFVVCLEVYKLVSWWTKWRPPFLNDLEEIGENSNNSERI